MLDDAESAELPFASRQTRETLQGACLMKPGGSPVLVRRALVERAELEAELVVVRALIEEMIERRAPAGFAPSDERDYEQLVARETILLDLLRQNP